MIRLRLLLAATLLLLLLQISSVEGKFSKDGCNATKACWVSHECSKTDDEFARSNTFYFKQYTNQVDDMKEECTKYLIVEPGVDHFFFEIMHEDIGENTNVKLTFNKGQNEENANSYFTCQNHKSTSGYPAIFTVEDEVVTEQKHLFCRFKVTKKTKEPGDTEFYTFLQNKFNPSNVFVEVDDEDKTKIKIDDYNNQHFKGRVPCSNSIFLRGVEGNAYNIEPHHSVPTRAYTCPSNYRMSYKLALADKWKPLGRTENVKCTYGVVVLNDKETDHVFSAKCSRLRYTFCDDICGDGKYLNLTCSIDASTMQRSIQCETTFMILNGFQVEKSQALCSDQSEPNKHYWKPQNSKTGDLEINDVKCVKELDCNDLAPFAEAKCDNCSKAEFGGEKHCNDDRQLVYIDESNKHHTASVTCNKQVGDWEIQYGGKSYTKNRDEAKDMKLACRDKEKESEEPAQPAAASSGPFLYIGIGLGVILLLLLILVLIYCICCRRRRQPPKEHSCQEPVPPSAPTTTKTESSNVEEPAPQAPPPTSESDHPQLFSGKRVQMINVSKEVLQKIEPDDPYKEVSARDKTDSDRSKASQMSQVGGTTDGGITFTGHGGTGGTEKTNDVSKTMAPGDDTRSDVSNGRSSSWMGDRSQTGGGGKTPTIADEARKAKKNGPRVEFRERVSYETDTKTRDKSTGASMHTAPEQPLPVVDSTQPDGNTVEGAKKKDEPSRLSADAARKTFGKQRTRTTQNTKETNEDANRSQMSTKQDSTVGNRSGGTDVSRTG